MLCLLSTVRFQSWIYTWNAALRELSNHGLCGESVASRAETVWASLAKNWSAYDVMR